MKTQWQTAQRAALTASALALLLAAPASAQRLIPFQGRVTDGAGQPLEGVFGVTFAIYDEATGGTALYVERHTDVSIIGGQVNVLLGSIVSLDDPNGDQNPNDAVEFDDALRPRYLGIKVGDDTNQEMVPRHQLVPSFHSRIADTTIDGGVGTEQLADGAVTVAKIAPEAVLPAGAIMPYGGRTAPPGWVLCDGTTYDGSLPEYAGIFNAIGTAFGGGGNMFQVPDLRGQFLRGLDAGAGVDPDFAGRSGGEGESKIGSTQSSAVVVQTGLANSVSASTATGGLHFHTLLLRSRSSGAPDPLGFGTYQEAGGSGFSSPTTNDNGAHSHSFTVPSHSVSITPSFGGTSTETRPTNVAVNYICKL